MSSKRDLVEAHSFNRRRLITAFTSGAPGGREVESPRHGRTLLGGAVLAVLVIVGAAITGVFKPTVPSGWNESGLVIGKESGSRFFAQDKTLYPVINTTSARLLMSPDDFKVRFVPDTQIAKEQPGPTIGIVGAPDVLPRPDALVQTGWTACVDSGGKGRVRVAEDPQVKAVPDQALVAKISGTTWVVAGDHRYEVAAGSEDAVLFALGLDSEPPRNVGANLLNLFPEGTKLGPLDVPGQGKPAAVDGVPADARTVGSLLSVDGKPYVVLAGGVAAITPVERELMRASVKAGKGDPADVGPSVLTQAGLVDSPFDHTWPTVLPHGLADASACALLGHESEGSLPTVSLAVPTGDGSRPGGQAATREVETGHGALVRATEGAVMDGGTVFLLDASGKAYALAGGSDTQWRLGYGKVKPTLVPPSWISLFAPGPELSSKQAALPVGSDG
jgi:type VII secretion protein EccB